MVIRAFMDNVVYQGQKYFKPNVDIEQILQSINYKDFKIIQKNHQIIKLKVLCFTFELYNLQRKNTIEEISSKFYELSMINQQLTTSLAFISNQMQCITNRLQLSQEKNAKLAQQLAQLQKKSAESQSEWIYYGAPKMFAHFNYVGLEEVTFSFNSIISSDIKARQMKLLIFLRTGNEKNTGFETRTRVINEGKDFQHWTLGWRYPQAAISYNSETVVFPIHNTRQIRVKANHIQPKNCHAIQYYIVAYRE